MELGETDQHPSLKVGKVAKTVTHTFYRFDRVVNTFNDARRDPMSKIV